MPVIDKFMPANDGGWIGTIRILTTDATVRFVPHDDRLGHNVQPSGCFMGQSRIGDAWETRSAGKSPKNYLSVKLTIQPLARPISGTLIPVEDGGTAQVMLNRK